MTSLERLVDEVRACRACEGHLPLGPRPVFQLSPGARILVASQAPGIRVHASGIPFSDPSGDRLREWMGVPESLFYCADDIAILPIGLCYPGRAAAGDAPPRPECAKLWREPLLRHLPNLKLTLLVGTHAQDHVLKPGTMTDRVRSYRSFLPRFFPLPHPSWRSRIWESKHPWFRAEVVPALRQAVREALE